MVGDVDWPLVSSYYWATADLDGSVDLALHGGDLRLHLDDFVGNASGGALDRRQVFLEPSHVASRRPEIRLQSG